MATTRTSRTRPPAHGEPGSRRRFVAETALAVLAEEGARGLTHRAVDERGGLPAGSTSYYFRTRGSLVAAAATCLCEADERDVAAAAKGGGAPWLLTRWGSHAHRLRLTARFELFLEATRNPQTRRLMQRQRAGFLDGARRAIAEATRVARATKEKTARSRRGARDAALRAELLVALMDGLLLAELVQPSRSFHTLQASVTQIVAGTLRPPRTKRG